MVKGEIRLIKGTDRARYELLGVETYDFLTLAMLRAIELGLTPDVSWGNHE